MEMHCFYFETRNEFLIIIYINFLHQRVNYRTEYICDPLEA
jgi:hypothetical protein